MATILICDDDRDIVSALNIYLSGEGYRTVEAYNGEEAIAAVRAGNIDLILMDVMMPKRCGGFRWMVGDRKLNIYAG
jgi:CheY-like chemotaxis protein